MTHLNWFDSFSFGGGASLVWIVAIWVITAIIHLAFAAAVYAEAELLWTRRRRRTFLVGSVIWALATLLGGVFVAAIYWVIHHSTLCPQPAASAATSPPSAPTNP